MLWKTANYQPVKIPNQLQKYAKDDVNRQSVIEILQDKRYVNTTLRLFKGHKFCQNCVWAEFGGASVKLVCIQKYFFKCTFIRSKAEDQTFFFICLFSWSEIQIIQHLIP